jgi:crotonobetainyl-CoA:carnitine CoA-transferase CaiB-like acyl-CoA transferase
MISLFSASMSRDTPRSTRFLDWMKHCEVHRLMNMLEGIRIVDLTTVIFGPYATQMLADLGADVIKIETAQGDTPRYMGQFKNTPFMGGTHLTVNRGKRSIVLDLKNVEDAAVLRKLLATADVFVHNVRAKAIERLGFGYEAAKAIKPDIIYAHFAGFGQDGPYADYPAYDDVIQAASGTTSLVPRVDGNPAPRYFPSLIADKVSGTYGAQAILAALVHKLRTGEGQHVEVPMLECFTSFMLTEHLQDGAFEPPIGPMGYARQLDPARQPFPTSDGQYLVIVPYTDAKIVRLFQLLGDPDFLTKSPLDTPKSRFLNMTTVYARIGDLTPQKTAAEWTEILLDNDFPVMLARDLEDVVYEPHLRATGFFRTRKHPTEGDIREMRPPVRYSAYPDRALGFAPTLGQHSDEIRREAAKT